MLIRKKKRPVWESVLSSALIGGVLVLTLMIVQKRDQNYKEKVLISELVALRSRVAAELLESRKLPPSLEGDKGIPSVDPFGNSYHYNPETGRVSSTTKSYRNW